MDTTETQPQFSASTGAACRRMGNPHTSNIWEVMVRPAEVMAVKRGPNCPFEIPFLRDFLADKTRPASIPRLVYESLDCLEFGITPVGAQFDPINVEADFPVRKILEDVMEAIKWLQSKNIVHRDVRASNIIVHNRNQGVLIDFDNAIDITTPSEVLYLGGYICCPEDHIRNVTWYGWKGCMYTPMLRDDCYAFVLLIVHCLYPHTWASFVYANIGVMGSDETARILALWKDLRESELWGPTMAAAEQVDWPKIGQVLGHFTML